MQTVNDPTQHTYLRFEARRLLEEIDIEQAVDLLMELLAYREVGALEEIGDFENRIGELVDERDELSNEVEEKNAIIRDLDGTIAELEEELDDLRSRS